MTHRRFAMAVYLIILVTLCDQMSKWAVLNFVARPPGYMPVNDFLNLVVFQNRGVTFGFLNQLKPAWAPYFLLGVASIILFLLGRWLWRTSSTPVAIALGLIIGGALGNMIDRVRFGAVIDFIDVYLRFAGREHHWYAFNVADSAIVTGVGLLLLDGLVRKR